MAGGTARTSDSQPQGNDPQKDNKNSSMYFSELVLRLVKNCFLLVIRFYLMIFLVAYEWAKKIIKGVLAPLEPIFVQVRKVPKKDIGVEGIFYQFLRLQFLIVLYFAPFFTNWIMYFAQPVMRIRGWAADFIGFDEPTTKRAAGSQSQD